MAGSFSLGTLGPSLLSSLPLLAGNQPFIICPQWKLRRSRPGAVAVRPDDTITNQTSMQRTRSLTVSRWHSCSRLWALALPPSHLSAVVDKYCAGAIANESRGLALDTISAEGEPAHRCLGKWCGSFAPVTCRRPDCRARIRLLRHCSGSRNRR
jgi:hypothetical protein